MLPLIHGIGLSVLLLSAGQVSFEGTKELGAARSFLEIAFDRVGDVALVVAVPVADPGGKKDPVLYWLDLRKREFQIDQLDKASVVGNADPSQDFGFLKAVIAGDRTATILCDVGGDRLLITKRLGSPAQVSRLVGPLAPSVLEVVAVRRGANGNLLLLGTASNGNAVVVEATREGTQVWRGEIPLAGGAIASDAQTLPGGDLALVGLLVPSPSQPRARTSWFARITREGHVEGLRQWPGEWPSLVPLKSGVGFAVLYEQDGQPRIEFFDPERGFGAPVVVPRGRRCGAVAVGSDTLFVECRDGEDSLIVKATRTGIGQETRDPGTHRLRPPILFERGGALFEISVVLDLPPGTSERLLWRWGTIKE